MYLHYSRRGRESPASQPPPPEYLLTQHSYKETSAPLSFLNSGTLIVIVSYQKIALPRTEKAHF
jgi:hypothetical protein